MIAQRIMTTPLMRFLIVGGASTFINYLVFTGLYSGKMLGYMPASAMGFLVGLAFGYIFNKRWTFGATAPSSPSIIAGYIVVYMTSLCLGLLAIHVLVAYARINPLVANGMSIILTTCTNFIGTRYLVFR
ncbi:GtrA family protein [Brucella anthropi]|uniref:GtrA family protein n=1 Tax=Brucella anthropi (strain ATCC 49188 / DSM 6882 / CCUG 24695 / JCM 21032 / LMG 3331 / NBRC 15819 / NCTC 12168 / Alc 37) TaxID=439375 RepID=A6X2K3_BRUA4|nr:GtrA family protein [Brucella anthropi]ABS15457.1 GtrA family protein [Brucella anthropi ATCC 49188]QQC24346.1 GtrA family protein [Brucella anthropi]SUA61328.1 GtrA-like protein [Brucella anthropi]